MQGEQVAMSHVEDRREADRQLRRLAAMRAQIDAEEAKWLRVAVRGAVHLHYGLATMLEYMKGAPAAAVRPCSPPA